MISIFVAMSKNMVIGNKNKLIWHLREDLKRFKQLTTGHPIIMGRNTYQSIGRPLPNRTNIVVTHDRNENFEGCAICHSIEEALGKACDIDKNEVFVIGGAQIYGQAIPFADRLYITEVDLETDGDTKFPDYDRSVWKEISRENHKKNLENEYDYSFVVYDRKK